MPSSGHYPRLPVAVTGAAVALVVAAAVRGVERVEVTGASMRPALEPGDRLVVLRRSAPRPGDVVAAADPRRPARVLVKRVAGVDADGRVRLVGDVPTASTDSRHFGPVPRDLVHGRVVWRYWPPHRRGRVRPLPAVASSPVT